MVGKGVVRDGGAEKQDSASASIFVGDSLHVWMVGKPYPDTDLITT